MKADPRAALSRRKLLGALALTLTGTSAVAAPALRLGLPRRKSTATSAPSMRPVALADAELEQWSQRVGTHFRIRGEAGISRITLVEVRPLEPLGVHRGAATRDRAFAAVFTARGASLPAGNRMYPVSHPQHGEMNLFFGPAGDKLIAIFA
jgi:hypothetical protein